MSQSQIDITKIFNSRGADGLSRLDRERMANYNRKDFLFDKFLGQRRQAGALQLTHEHILGWFIHFFLGCEHFN